MAISTAGSNGSNGRRRRGGVSIGTMSEMNVVPLVDVVLVLLIIFMLTAHVMEFGLDVQAPVVQETRDSAEDLPVVTITRDGKYYLNDTPVKNINLLAPEIRKRFQTKSVYVLGDRRAIYEGIVSVIGVLGREKFDIKLVAKPEDVGK